jgi:hypothetical protein
MKIPFLSLATIAFIVTGCATNPQPRNVPLHDALPEIFKLTTDSWETYEEINLENGYLVRRTFYNDMTGPEQPVRRLKKTEYFVPTREQWLAFWENADHLKIWSWKKRYNPADIGSTVYDGGACSFELRYRGKHMSSLGVNAGPKPGDPQVTVVSVEGWSGLLAPMLFPSK